MADDWTSRCRCGKHTLLWCSESWILTVSERRALTSAQNSMLRRIAGLRRKEDQDWPEWIRTSTHRARSAARHAGVRFWEAEQLRKKWEWAGHVARMDSARIARRVMEWRDAEWQKSEQDHMSHRHSLRICRPFRTHWFRWEDQLRKMAQSSGWDSWKSLARQKDVWALAKKDFVNFFR